MPSRSSLPSTSPPSADTPPAPVGQAFLPSPLSGTPPQRHRPIHRMHHRRARPPRLQEVCLQREIPFRLPVGVAVARLENHSFPLRSISVRRFGNTKSIVVVTGSPVILASSRYGALFALGWCGLIRNPFGIGSNCFAFS